MSTNPSSGAGISFFGPPESIAITAKSSDEYTWLAFDHEVFDHRDADLPSRCAVGMTMWGSPEELHAFALRVVAAIEAAWYIECPNGGTMHHAGCAHEAKS